MESDIHQQPSFPIRSIQLRCAGRDLLRIHRPKISIVVEAERKRREINQSTVINAWDLSLLYFMCSLLNRLWSRINVFNALATTRLLAVDPDIQIVLKHNVVDFSPAYFPLPRNTPKIRWLGWILLPSIHLQPSAFPERRIAGLAANLKLNH